ncbi:uncharacterized protein LOC144436357 [Glandiceps talaboti]
MPGSRTSPPPSLHLSRNQKHPLSYSWGYICPTPPVHLGEHRLHPLHRIHKYFNIGSSTAVERHTQFSVMAHPVHQVNLTLTEEASRGNEERVRDLLEHGADVHQKNKYGRTAIQVMNFSSANIARMLLDKGALVNQSDDVGRAPIHDAAEAGYVDTLKVLSDYGADLTAQDRWGNTPAHIAAKRGNSSALNYLVKGSNLLTRNSENHSVVDVALAAKNKLVVDCVTKQLDGSQSLKHLCLLSIRKTLGVRINQVCTLPLPDQLKNYIKLQ